MKYGILGDIHANLSALETVLEELDGEGIDTLVSVGDVVGYGAAPSECIALLRERGAVVVLGNHDAACAGLLSEHTFNPYARAAVAWTREALARSELDWLGALPLTAVLEHCEVAHGTLHAPERFDYILGAEDAEPSLDVMTRPVCFVGHSHIALCAMRLTEAPDRTAYTFDPVIDLREAWRALVNVGSVGQPRDEDPRTGYALYDAEARRVEIRRVPYDFEREARRIEGVDLPELLAQRLRLGV